MRNGSLNIRSYVSKRLYYLPELVVDPLIPVFYGSPLLNPHLSFVTSQKRTRIEIAVELHFEPETCPYQNLLAAILVRGLLDLNHEDEQRGAVKWIMRSGSSDVPFSFRWVCDHLNMCAEKIQARAIKTHPHLDWE